MICGGKEAEIDDAITELNIIKDKVLIQSGLIGDYLPILLRIAKTTLQRHLTHEA